jgi:TonB family protein
LYEPIARSAGIKGDVVLQFQIDQAGNVGQIQLISGHPLLAKQAETNLKLWQFTSSTARTLTVKYEFRFAGAPADQQPISTVSFDLPYRVRVTSRPPRIDHGPSDSLP